MDPEPLAGEGARSATSATGLGRLRFPRRMLLRWAGAMVLGASAIVGKLAGFAPSAAAVVITCITITGRPPCRYSCLGDCNQLRSCCYNRADQAVGCCCICDNPPCSPPVFRAKGVCKANGNVRCCCVTC